MIQMEEVNVMPPFDDMSSIIDPISYLSKIGQFPRDPDPKYIPPEKEIEVIKWIFPMSLFKEFRQDTDVRLLSIIIPRKFVSDASILTSITPEYLS